MDLSHTHSQQAISASLPQPTELSSAALPSLQTNTSPSDSSRTLRSTTRARAAKQKVAQDTDIPDQTTSAPAESSSRQTRSNYHPYPSKRTRDTKGKGKSHEITEEQPIPRTSKKGRRTTYPITSSSLTINEPTRDTKGKKRAAPEALPEELSASVLAGPYKRPRPAPTAYALRSRSDTNQPSVSEMPKKLR
jgi:E3 ubiquitin-protein ligase TRIP12